MLGVTIFGLVFTPVFYVVCRWIAELVPDRRRRVATAAPPAPPVPGKGIPPAVE